MDDQTKISQVIPQDQCDVPEAEYRIPTIGELLAMSPLQRQQALRVPTFSDIVSCRKDESQEGGQQ
jgi:hypothetical protein